MAVCGLGRCEAQCRDSCGSGCSGSCDGSCKGGCEGDCKGCDGCSGCGRSCSNSCSGCRGTCSGSCQGCSGSCTGSCSGCSGSCTGSCAGSCTGTCTGTCNNQCNTACTSLEASETVAHLGENIALGHIIKAVDYSSLKSAMDKEYSRRSKPVPSGFTTNPEAGNPVLYEITYKVLEDVYNFDQQPAHDWRNIFAPNDLADATKLEPVIAYIKTLMSQIT